MTENKNGSKGLIIGLIALAVICGAGWLLNYYVMPKGEEGAKTIQVQVVHSDQSAKDLEYHTDAAYLGEVLKAEKLVEGEEGQYGLFITAADGESVEGTDWWCITKDGEMLNTSADQTPIEDGEHYELTYTAG